MHNVSINCTNTKFHSCKIEMQLNNGIFCNKIIDIYILL